MATSDITKITSRILWIIGAQSGAFDTTVSDDRFILEEVRRAILETEAEVVRVLATSRHPLRSTLITWSTDLTNETKLPTHIGKIEAVKIKPYSAASGYNLAEAASRDDIRQWRANVNNIFDPIAHDQSGSLLAGYFNITNEVITFTGNVAQVYACVYSPDYTTPALQVDNELDPTLVAGAVIRLNKLGIPQALIESYGALYKAGLDDLRGGGLDAPSLAVVQANE